jgi:competence protein ComEC
VERAGFFASSSTDASYDAGPGHSGHRPGKSATTRAALVVFVLWGATLAGEHVARLASWRLGTTVLCAGLVVWAGRHTSVLITIAAVLGLTGGATAWHAVPVVPTVACGGMARLVTDPEGWRGATEAVVELNGHRLRVTARGTAAGRLAARVSGESVRVEGRCSPAVRRHERVRHVTGRLEARTVSEGFSPGSAAVRASTRVRRAVTDGVATMDHDKRSLFTGLVIGDDRDQPADMVARFRASGLSHLCAVSGQNVAHVLAAFSPLLRRRRPAVRLALTLGLLAWFALLTRMEPSVLRACTMAGAVALNGAWRLVANPRLILCLSAGGLLVVDPMLAFSVGFALSVSATAGLAWLSAPIGRHLGVLTRGRVPRLREVTAATLAAQVGTAPVLLLVFGSVPVVSLVANPLAVGVAGIVMLVGLPAALLAAVVPVLEPVVSRLLAVPVGWVDLVARVCAAVGPTGAANLWCWAGVGVVAAVAWRRTRWRNGAGATAV